MWMPIVNCAELLDQVVPPRTPKISRIRVSCVANAAPAPRPVARAQRMRFAVASTPKQGTYGGSTSPMGEDKEAKNEAAGCVAVNGPCPGGEASSCTHVRTSAALQRIARTECICSIYPLWCCTDSNFCKQASTSLPCCKAPCMPSLGWAPVSVRSCTFLRSLSRSHELDVLTQGRSGG